MRERTTSNTEKNKLNKPWNTKDPERPEPSCQVELYASPASGWAKQAEQGVLGVTALYEPTNVQKALFVSSIVMFVRTA
jgi:hypothetical protein